MKRILHVALALRHFEKNSFFMGGGGEPGEPGGVLAEHLHSHV